MPYQSIIYTILAAPFLGDYTLVNIQKAMENGHSLWIYPLKMVIFHSYSSKNDNFP